MRECSSILFRNHLSIEETASGIRPLRFSSKQLAVYEDSPIFKPRSLSPSGICIDVWTDAIKLTMEVEIRNRMRPLGYFDLFVNDQLKQSIEVGDPEMNPDNLPYQYCFHLQADAGECQRITLYLPHNMELIIRDLNWEGASRIEAVTPPRRNLLCLGDSITQGMTAHHPSCTYPVLLARALDVNLLNQGVGGYYYEANSLDMDLDYQPDLITVAYGTNDWRRYTHIEQFKTQVTAYMRKLAQLCPTSRICVITPLTRLDKHLPTEIGSFDLLVRTIEEACSGYAHIEVIRGLDLIPNDPAMFADLAHPLEAGFAIMAERLLAIIKR